MAYEATLLYHPLTTEQLDFLYQDPREHARYFEQMGSDVFLTGIMDGRSLKRAIGKATKTLNEVNQRKGRQCAALLWRVPTSTNSHFDARQYVCYIGPIATKNLYGDWKIS